MSQVATLPAPDKGELDRALKKQKQAAKATERKEHLKKRDNLLQRISSLSHYKPIRIEYRAAVSYLPSNIFFTLYIMFSLI